MKGLNIGSGPVYLDSDPNISWENSDFADSESAQSWRIDKKRDFTAPMDDIDDNSIDYIIAWHIIEHVGLHENGALVKEWFRVLKPGGKILIACPDLTEIAKHIVNRDGPWADWYICMVNLFGPYNGYIGDYHKWGYDEENLAKLFIENGYAEAIRMSPQMAYQEIGIPNGQKLAFAPYNVQLLVRK